MTGIITPFYEISKLMHQNEGCCFVDFACSAPYVEVDMHPEDKECALDAIFFSPHKFLGGPGTPGIMIFNKKGYNVFPINPNAENIEGDNCYPDLLSLPEKIDAVVINVPPEETEKVVLKVHQAGIEKVWMQQGSQSDEAITYCEENRVDYISNECILMFAEPAGFIHRAHK